MDRSIGGCLPASYARGLQPVEGKDVVVMAGRGLWPRIAAGWRWLTGPGWDSKQVDELYGKLTNRGYGGGLVDVVARQESSPVRPQRAAPPERPDAES
jgi:hypothetical protein